MRDWLCMCAALLAMAVVVWLLFAMPVKAHEWYPYECCSDKDCREFVEDKGEWVTEEGKFYVLWDGRRYPKDKARMSPDGKFHGCERADKTLICFFAPPGTM